MAASSIADAQVTHLVSVLRSVLATGVVTKLTGKDIELLLSALERQTSSDLSGSLTDVAANDALDGRPAAS